jgi:hypothetical protein
MDAAQQGAHVGRCLEELVYFEQVDSTVLVLQLTVIVLDSILDSVGYVLVGC